MNSSILALQYDYDKFNFQLFILLTTYIICSQKFMALNFNRRQLVIRHFIFIFEGPKGSLLSSSVSEIL